MANEIDLQLSEEQEDSIGISEYIEIAIIGRKYS